MDTIVEPTEADRAAMEAHRARYEALKAAGTGAAPLALPPPTGLAEAPLDPARIVARETVPGGWYSTLRLARGEALRLIDTAGSGAAALFAWNAADPSERLNHADTVKVQWTTRLAKGRVLLSDMGRVLLSIVEDTTDGAHDPLVGVSNAAGTLAKYGPGTFRNGRDNLVQGALKLGLSRRDLAPVVTFFAPVIVASDGRFAWGEAARQAGAFVELRAEMDLLLVVSAAPHPLDPRPDYAPGPIELVRLRTAPVAADDPCRTATPEARRAFENTDFWLAG
ncbi:urea amidolyase associated protein UAAP1 [Prosthecomicrobium pneumaticum]|uniref:DUF1989 domain-containing protein n=1 Tax=Prosthecomicrobium pneumaticum TaxID=81895 RepID=A0A7W9FQE7_9HYPH|nr:urea amidolyase associated protein UAAP1 [Prosthecomicrobium pneumaticum]MBB5754856.1 hypothetical protein [Prosthecomicrobium pneumaticum]